MTTSFGPFQLGHSTHQGPRESNQDTILSIKLPEGRWLLAVADGMGGLEEGDLASKTALGALYRSLLGGSDLETATRDANTAVRREAKGRKMGTTLVAAVVSGRRAEIVCVGDSRAYNSDILGLIQVTEDHTMAYEAARTGSLAFDSPEELGGRWADALARYLGLADDIEVDRFGPVELLQGGWLVLCSDGLHGVMSLEEIDTFLHGHSDASEAASALVEEALNRSTGDNVSVLTAHWPDPSAKAEPPRNRRSRARSGVRESILKSTGRRKPTRKKLPLAAKVFLIVIPLTILLVFLVNWVLSLAP
jgi:protein phosphatase